VPPLLDVVELFEPVLPDEDELLLEGSGLSGLVPPLDEVEVPPEELVVAEPVELELLELELLELELLDGLGGFCPPLFFDEPLPDPQAVRPTIKLSVRMGRRMNKSPSDFRGCAILNQLAAVVPLTISVFSIFAGTVEHF
jgi:hypothetical protein